MRTFISTCIFVGCFFFHTSVIAGGFLPIPLKSLENPVQRSGEFVGTISIPDIGLRDSIFEGVHESVIDRGIGHWAGSALAGEEGNIILGAHRVYTVGGERPGPFYLLDELEGGDAIYLTREDGTGFVYYVTAKSVIHETEVAFVTSPQFAESESLLTLFTCHPPGENKHRLVIRAILAGDIEAPQ